MLAFWLLIVLLIWLHLFGFRSPIDGRFSRPEILLTVGIGAFCVGGLASAIRGIGLFRSMPAVFSAILGLSAQVFAMWVSLLPGVATR